MFWQIIKLQRVLHSDYQINIQNRNLNLCVQKKSSSNRTLFNKSIYDNVAQLRRMVLMQNLSYMIKQGQNMFVYSKGFKIPLTRHTMCSILIYKIMKILSLQNIILLVYLLISWMPIIVFKWIILNRKSMTDEFIVNEMF